MIHSRDNRFAYKSICTYYILTHCLYIVASDLDLHSLRTLRYSWK